MITVTLTEATEQKLAADLRAAFGATRTARGPTEKVETWAERMQAEGYLHVTTRAELKADVRAFQAFKAAEATGTVVWITDEAPPAPPMIVARPSTLAEYKTAVAAAERAGKPLAFE